MSSEKHNRKKEDQRDSFRLVFIFLYVHIQYIKYLFLFLRNESPWLGSQKPPLFNFGEAWEYIKKNQIIKDTCVDLIKDYAIRCDGNSVREKKQSSFDLFGAESDY